MAIRSRLVELLAKDEPAFGGLIHSGDISGARKMGDSTFDFLVVDMEHEGFDMPRFGDTLQWLMSRRRMEKTGSIYPSPTPIVRLPHTAADSSLWIAQQALDYGALGVVLPYTETAEQVERMVRAMRYPREQADGSLFGERRVWPKAALRYWGCSTFEEYLELSDLWPVGPTGENVLIAMVATPAALANIDEIAAVPGLSGILFGAKHAWSALGRWAPIDLDHEDLEMFRNSVLKACLANGIAAGCSLSAIPPGQSAGVVDHDFMLRRVDDGFRFFLTQGAGRPDLEALRRA
ncbi:putative 4-hydroxy-2-oxovalerate aldolase [metagenome]|uniref:Putative 4-hydroxy-2-oxovalerate aldolase n=1 Tax=metagenome TaxID=256318 RepID=A0A2P2C8Y0_9ZZZZ